MVKARNTWKVAGIGLIFLLLSFTQTGSNRYFEISKNLEIFASVYKEVNEYYVDDINPNALMQVGIDAMLSSLDPYTNYISEDRIEEFRTENTGQYAGIGAQFVEINGKIIVTMLVEGFPAHKNGLLIGDEILAIDGVDINNLSEDDVLQLLKGQAKTKVELRLKRTDIPSPIELSFVREKVQIESVPHATMIDAETGYFRLTEFTMNAGRDVKKAVELLKTQGAKQLVFDLRENPGGLLIEAVNITNIFIPKGLEVVSTRGKIERDNVTFKTLNSPTDTEIPLVILINSGSASASEIVAGTLQDYDRAVILGKKSYGKGLVQVSRPLSYNSQLKVTTAKYYTPSGRCIQALDYTNRNEDGSVGKVADSLKRAFQTSRGRVVYDGGGIDPDVSIEEGELPEIVQQLLIDASIFDYATLYYHKHPTIDESRKFTLTDQDFSNFTAWLKTRDFQYQTELEDEIHRLEILGKEEGIQDQIYPITEKIKKEIKTEKSREIYQQKKVILSVLKEEIVSRYYFEKGILEASFGDDEYISRAIEILNNRVNYNNILR